MTQREWLASEDPGAILAWLAAPVPPGGHRIARSVSDRKLRLFAVACMRMAGIPPERCDDVERSGPPRLEPTEAPASDATFARAWTEKGSDKPPLAAKAALLRDIVGDPFRPVKCRQSGNRLGTDTVMVRGDGGLAGCDCAWLTPAVRLLASCACEDRDPRDGTLDRLTLAAVADALEEAGCPAEEGEYAETDCPECEGAGEVYGDYFAEDGMGPCEKCEGRGRVWADVNRPHPLLAHLRSPGPHVRGCWAVDLVLGRA